MADIVLKDRNGRDVQYPGVNYLKVNTVDGGTQGFAAYDPETLKAENIKNGVTVGDVEGALEVPELLENLPIAVDFSNGNMEITAEEGYAVKSAVIQQPANLVPGNIAKDVDIAGVVGTLEAGGGGSTPCIFVSTYAYAYSKYYTSATTATFQSSVDIGENSEILKILADAFYSTSTSTNYSINAASRFTPAEDQANVTITRNGGMITATNPRSVTAGSHVICVVSLQVFSTTPGWTVGQDDSGNNIVYADNSVSTVPWVYQKTEFASMVHTVDLSNSLITATPWNWLLRGHDDIRVIKFPATLTALRHGAFSLMGSLDLLDMSKCTAVPTLEAANTIPKNEGLQILVPAALYDTWIATGNWSGYADYIVPV